MAGDWLKFEKSTSDKPEVWAMADQLAIDPDAVVGKLLRVWAWFDEQSEEGNAPSVSKSLLDRRVGVSGFCDAMVLCGWMLDDGKEVTLPNFDRHNGKTAKNRSLTAKRVAKHKVKTNATGNGDSVTNALPREEKRREENNKPPISPKGESVPFSEIFALYHEMLPELPPAPNQTEKRKKNISQRWRETVKVPSADGFKEMPCNDLDFWRRFFNRVRNSPHLMGENERSWQANLEWITKKENFYKIIEGNYVRDK